jgi:hypothetical protein
VFTFGVNCVYNHENSSCGFTPSKYVARVVVVIMTEALGESFWLNEFETGVIENVAAVPCLHGKAKAKFFTVLCWINSFCSSLCALWR